MTEPGSAQLAMMAELRLQDEALAAPGGELKPTKETITAYTAALGPGQPLRLAALHARATANEWKTFVHDPRMALACGWSGPPVTARWSGPATRTTAPVMTSRQGQGARPASVTAAPVALPCSDQKR